MDVLRVKYETQLKEYDALIGEALEASDTSQLPRLRTLNTSIGSTLNEMIQQLTFLKKDTPDLKKERDELIIRLRRIQQDYDGLRVNTDELETLRRIRQQESSEANQILYMYLFFFFIVCLVIVLYLLFMTHRKDMTAARASMPPTTAAFV